MPNLNNLNNAVQRACYIVKFAFGRFERIAYLFPSAEDLANGVLFSSPNENNSQLTAQLPGGGTVTIPYSSVLMVEEYKVTGKWDGKSYKTVSKTGESIADYTRNSGGDSTRDIRKIQDSKGNTVYKRDENDL